MFPMLIPYVCLQGALAGGVCGFAFPMWISIGAYVTKPPVAPNLNTTIDGCPVDNSTDWGSTTMVTGLTTGSSGGGDDTVV